MEKVIVTLRHAAADEAWCAALRTDLADRLLASDPPGLTVNVKDDAVRASLMTLTTLDPPVVALVGLWTEQCYGEEVTAALDVLGGVADVAAYLVTESVPLPPPQPPPGERSAGFANVALLRRPAGLDPKTWLDRWHLGHTPVAIRTQATFGYVQNAVVRPLTDGAPALDAIVEELFPLEATTNLHAFFGAADDADLSDRMTAMVASTSSFGANENIDTVPTSRYVYRSPFEPERS